MFISLKKEEEKLSPQFIQIDEKEYVTSNHFFVKSKQWHSNENLIILQYNVICCGDKKCMLRKIHNLKNTKIQNKK